MRPRVMNRLLQYLYQFVSQIWRRPLSLLRRGRYEREMEEEMRFHLEMQIEQNLASGMAAEEAHYAARRQFGNQTWLKEASREMWSLNSIETLIQDLRYALRTLMKSPGFAFIAVLTLALGIGANTAIFSVVNGVLLRALPYYEPERLVMVWADRPILQAQLGIPYFPVTVADFVDWRKENQVFEQMAALEPLRMNLTGGGEPESLVGLRASASLFPALGASFAAGRAFLPEEDQAGADRVVVISHGLWRQRYAADPKLIGQKVTLDNESYTVIGVTAPEFQFPRRGEIPYVATKVDLYLPIAFTPAIMNNRREARMAVIALRRRLRGFLVVSEVALAFVLLIGAGLLIRSFARLTEVDPGIDPRGVLTMDIILPHTKYSGGRIAAFYQQTLERVRALPGVEAAAATNSLPLSGSQPITGFGIEGRPSPTYQTFTAGWRRISPDYFSTFRIPLVKGRLLKESDSADAPPVLAVNESLARIYFANEDPLGKRIIYNGVTREIVGVVGDIKHSALDEEAKPEIYMTMAQAPWPFMSLAVRTSGDPMQMLAQVREQVLAVDKDQPVTNIRTMERLMARSVAPRRFNLLLLGMFALVGLALAAVGLYGVMSYTVMQRTREIGVRMAMGAQRVDVLRLVIGEGLKLAFIGALLGLGGALAFTRLLKTLLFGVSATDPLTFIVIAAVLIIVAMLACWIPARRAASMDPLVALRVE
jgi:hypothetical protein